MNDEAQRLNNISTNLFKEGKRHTAKALIAKALSEEPDNECYLCNYAVLLTNFGEYIEVRCIFERVLRTNPKSLLVWHGLGVLGMVEAKPDLAIPCFEKCIELDPNDGSHRFDLACAVIQSGDWDRGFELYEYRKTWRPERTFPQFAPWNGESGEKVYVWAEQGMGDTIQYARYVNWLSSISKKVTLAVPPQLLPLFDSMKNICTVVSLVGAMVDADYHVPLMSLAHYYKRAGHSDIPAPHDFHSMSWSNFQSNGKFKVGVAWACNPSSINYLERTLPLEGILKLTEIGRTEFISLQVGNSTADIARLSAQNLIQDKSYEINDNWDATRNLIMQCDYVVSTDTSVAHLAASMGVPTIMFLARRDWWRWGNDGVKTIWYPGMKIIRNQTPFKWENEIKQAYAILENAVKNRASASLAA